jgi:Zn-dependent M28 family amino/carboxypeptidase
VLFSGEDEGLIGSREYVKVHEGELPKISAVLIHDSGTGKVVSINLEGDYAAREVMDEFVESVPQFGLLEPSLRNEFGSDDHAFFEAGVPGFLTIQDPADYAQSHHSMADTFDRVRKEDLQEGAEVLAVWAYHVAPLPGLMPRQQEPKKTTGQ